MKKGLLIVIITLAALTLISWRGLNVPVKTITQELASFQGKSNVLQFKPASGGYDWNVFTYDLSQYVGQLVEINVSMQIWLDAPATVHWQISNAPEYKSIAGSYSSQLSARRWHAVQGSGLITVQQGFVLYFTSWNFNNTSGYIADLDIKVNPVNITYDNNVPALHSKWPFRIGAAVFPGEVLQSNPINGLLRHFNVLTTGTLYPSMIMPEPWTPTGAYRFSSTDELINYAEANGKNVRGHVLFWHQSTPVEFFRGSGRDGWVTKNELYSRMENHTRTVFEKYRDKISWWDVCNEVVGDNGTVRSGPGRRANNNMNLNTNFMPYSLYTQVMEAAGNTGINRYEWIIKAFQLARQYADANGGQDVKLYLTDYSIENRGAKQTEFLRLLDYLIANNTPVDGVGIQGHIRYDAGRNYIRDLGNAIDAITSRKNPVTGRNLIVQVCELDISLFSNDETSWENPSSSRKTLSDREFNTRSRQQTTLYRELFDMLEQKYNQGKVDMVILWGTADRESWLNSVPVNSRVDYPLLFDYNYQPKPAFHELIRGR